MRSLGILFLLVCSTIVRAGPVSHDSSIATNSADSSRKPSIYVTGQVQKPGRYDWFQGMTVVDAITTAGGLKQSNGHYTRITRTDGTAIMFHADTFPYGVSKPPLLKAGDTVEVRKKLERPKTAEPIATTP